MNTEAFAAPLSTLLSELVDGTPPTGGYMLNRNDVGLLRSLDKLSAAEASEIVDGGSSIAAHVDHCTYYVVLMNRWAAGERNPWKTADWAVSWTRSRVDEDAWANSRAALAEELRKWSAFISEPRELERPGLTAVLASVIHLGYHLGAIRQMDRRVGGPRAGNLPDAFTEPSSRP